MPYIKERREDYRRLIAEKLMPRLSRETWGHELAVMLWWLGTLVYGDGKCTRYFRQNEWMGVLHSMALEWCRRMKLPVAAPRDVAPQDPQIKAGAFQPFVDGVLAILPVDDAEQRPGDLNFLVTEIFNILVDPEDNYGWINPGEVQPWVCGFAAWFYSRETGAYENSAISKNGDAFRASVLELGA